MTDTNPGGPKPQLETSNLKLETLPRHIAMIMDGNGRWARERGLERVEGHVRGAETVRRVVEECCRLGIGQLTLYSFSSENWKRPQREVDFLMGLLKEYLIAERPEIMQQNIRFRLIGRRAELAPGVIQEVEETERISSGNTGLTLALAVNYASRPEILDAVRSIAERGGRGETRPDEEDEEDWVPRGEPAVLEQQEDHQPDEQGPHPQAGAEHGSGGRRLEPAEPSLPAGVVAQGGVENVGRKVRPADRRHPQLGVRDLPEQVVAHSHLAGRADQQVRVGHAGRVE